MSDGKARMTKARYRLILVVFYVVYVSAVVASIVVYGPINLGLVVGTIGGALFRVFVLGPLNPNPPRRT